ncbi:unnamed protein product, partial [Ascophyllum nodosum]
RDDPVPYYRRLSPRCDSQRQLFCPQDQPYGIPHVVHRPHRGVHRRAGRKNASSENLHHSRGRPGS